MNKNLSKRSNHAELITTPQSLPERCIGKMLEITAQVMGKELTEPEVLLWSSLTEAYSNQAIEWAFRCHLRTSNFFPKPAEILALVTEYKQCERNLEIAVQEEKSTTEAAVRKAEYEAKGGEYISFNELMVKIKEIAATKTIERKQSRLRPIGEIKALSDIELADRKEILRQQADKLRERERNA